MTCAKLLGECMTHNKYFKKKQGGEVVVLLALEIRKKETSIPIFELTF